MDLEYTMNLGYITHIDVLFKINAYWPTSSNDLEISRGEAS